MAASHCSTLLLRCCCFLPLWRWTVPPALREWRPMLSQREGRLEVLLLAWLFRGALWGQPLHGLLPQWRHLRGLAPGWVYFGKCNITFRCVCVCVHLMGLDSYVYILYIYHLCYYPHYNLSIQRQWVEGLCVAFYIQKTCCCHGQAFSIRSGLTQRFHRICLLLNFYALPHFSSHFTHYICRLSSFFLLFIDATVEWASNIFLLPRQGLLYASLVSSSTPQFSECI